MLRDLYSDILYAWDLLVIGLGLIKPTATGRESSYDWTVYHVSGRGYTRRTYNQYAASWRRGETRIRPTWRTP